MPLQASELLYFLSGGWGSHPDLPGFFGSHQLALEPPVNFQVNCLLTACGLSLAMASEGYSVAVRELLMAVASLLEPGCICEGFRVAAHGLSSCRVQAQLL